MFPEETEAKDFLELFKMFTSEVIAASVGVSTGISESVSFVIFGLV
jgi:hypothetical protein